MALLVFPFNPAPHHFMQSKFCFLHQKPSSDSYFTSLRLLWICKCLRHNFVRKMEHQETFVCLSMRPGWFVKCVFSDENLFLTYSSRHGGGHIKRKLRIKQCFWVFSFSIIGIQAKMTFEKDCMWNVEAATASHKHP